MHRRRCRQRYLSLSVPWWYKDILNMQHDITSVVQAQALNKKMKALVPLPEGRGEVCSL
jgi:hypothetical protein